MSDFLNESDDDLTLLIKQDKMGAFTEIYRRYWAGLYNSAYKRLHNHEACEEIVQDLFIKLWEKRNALVLTTGLGSYLYTAIKYSVIDHYRKQLVRENFLQMNGLTMQVDNSTEESIFLNDLMQHLEKVISSLPVKCRSVYRLSRIEHKTNKEIAIILNISEKTVEGHLSKALHTLRLNLSALCITLLAALFK